MEKVRRFLLSGLERGLMFLFCMLVIDVSWQVFARYFVDVQTAFTEELARYILIWLALLGTAYVRSFKGQMSIDYLYKKLNKRSQFVITVLIEVVICLFTFAVMIVGGVNLMYITLKLGQISPALNFPIGYVYSVVPISGLVIIFFSIYHCFHPTESTQYE
jgi:TRAP-type C4-dicarboxylate transport system permease small subunit